MKTRINLNHVNIKKLAGDLDKATKFVAESALTAINVKNVVPKYQGYLEASGYVGIEESKPAVIWDTPYAGRLYEHPEYNFRKSENPNAQGAWADDTIKDIRMHEKSIRTYMKSKGVK